ncbi:hypothetical protein TorRG33x02_282620 [Trema orientale]|uniref:Transmembrane protein n=1 Tax=Trema orientale TaxID=63057 RepID=A0A2P5CJC5_TREOI|nr:hypothetical protein TorRG33x02_282620 [Trema orientale]
MNSELNEEENHFLYAMQLGSSCRIGPSLDHRESRPRSSSDPGPNSFRAPNSEPSCPPWFLIACFAFSQLILFSLALSPPTTLTIMGMSSGCGFWKVVIHVVWAHGMRKDGRFGELFKLSMKEFNPIFMKMILETYKGFLRSNFVG